MKNKSVTAANQRGEAPPEGDDDADIMFLNNATAETASPQAFTSDVDE